MSELRPCPVCKGEKVWFQKDGEGECDAAGHLLFCATCGDCDVTIGWFADPDILETLWNAMADAQVEGYVAPPEIKP